MRREDPPRRHLRPPDRQRHVYEDRVREGRGRGRGREGVSTGWREPKQLPVQGRTLPGFLCKRWRTVPSILIPHHGRSAHLAAAGHFPLVLLLRRGLYATRISAGRHHRR